MANTVMGGDLMIFVGTTIPEPIAYATGAKLETSVKLIDVNTKDTGTWASNIPDNFNWKVSSDHLLTFDSITGAKDFSELWNDYINKTLITISFAPKTGTAPGWTIATGSYKFVGTGYITSLSVNADNSAIANYSISIEGEGELTLTTT